MPSPFFAAHVSGNGLKNGALPSQGHLQYWLNMAMIAAILSVPLIELSMRYAMCALLLVCGPMQLLRSIPYDIRVFIVTHGRVSFSLLRHFGQTMQASQHLEPRR